MADTNQESSRKSPNQKRRTRITQPEKKIAEDEFMAAAIGDVEWLRQSLRGNRGAINYDKNGLAPIHLAAIHGRYDCLKLLIEKFKIDVNLPSKTGWRPVHLCISNQTGQRAYRCLQYLLEKNADPSVTNDDNITPMHQAATEGHVQCLKALIDTGALVTIKDNRGHRPIDLAKLWGHRKCARILAAESWHQDKDALAGEMKQLQKIKMQQVLLEMEDAENQKVEQAFYGEMAFNQWLQNRGLSKSPTGPPSAESEMKGTKGATKKGKKESKSEKKDSLYKANSMQRPTQPKRGPSPIQEEPAPVTTRKRELDTFPSSPDGGRSQRTRSSRSRETEQEKEGEIEEVPEGYKPSFFQGPAWNCSTKLPEKEYVNMLQDHYPRDEFSMMPKYVPKRMSRSPTLIMADEEHGRQQTRQEKVKMPHLPADVINKKLDPSKFERPVVYKCKHIGDVHKKLHKDIDSLPRQEAGIHLTNDFSSMLFKLGLTKSAPPGTSSTTISELDWDEERRAEKDAFRKLHQPQVQFGSELKGF